MKPLVSVVMGSDSDLPVVAKTLETLKKFQVDYEKRILSAHRTPAQVTEWAAQLEENGVQVVIAAAGGAAHLAGVIAAHTILPVIGLPIPGSSLAGADSLYSMVQMPGGIPVGVVGLGSGGAKNAALLTIAILALQDDRLKAALHDYRQEQASAVLEKDRKLQGEL